MYLFHYFYSLQSWSVSPYYQVFQRFGNYLYLKYNVYCPGKYSCTYVNFFLLIFYLTRSSTPFMPSHVQLKISYCKPINFFDKQTNPSFTNFQHWAFRLVVFIRLIGHLVDVAYFWMPWTPFVQINDSFWSILV